MEQLRIKTELLYNVLKFPIIIFNSTGETTYAMPKNLENMLPAYIMTYFSNLYKEQIINSDAPLIHFVKPSFYYGLFQINEDMLIAIGPISPNIVSKVNSMALANSIMISPDRIPEYVDMLSNIPPTAFSQFLDIMSFIFYDYCNIYIASENITVYHIPEDSSTDHSLTTVKFDFIENNNRYTPYNYSMKVMNTISAGDTDQLRKILMQKIEGIYVNLSTNPIRRSMYIFLNFLTQVTHAAIEGGLDENLAYSLRDIYINKADTLTALHDFQSITVKVAFDFTTRVAALHPANTLSPKMKLCYNYIQLHLHEKISTKDLEKISELSARSLTNKFKNETGMSIPDYINNEKIKEAKSLLIYTNLALSEISSNLAFSSQSYFTSAFKKFANMTPIEYRKKNMKS